MSYFEIIYYLNRKSHGDILDAVLLIAIYHSESSYQVIGRIEIIRAFEADPEADYCMILQTMVGYSRFE